MRPRYELRPRGVFDRDEGAHILPDASDPRWVAYTEWLAGGNAPDAPPGPSLVERRRSRMDRVNLRRERALMRPVQYMGREFAADAHSMMRLNMAITLIAAGAPLPEGFVWRAADNTAVAMTAEELRGLLLAMFRHHDAVFRRSWAMKREIEASDAPETINIEEGWPGEPPPSNELPPMP